MRRMESFEQTGRNALHGREFVSLLFALLLVSLIGIFSYRTWITFDSRSEQLEITRQVARATNRLLSALKDAETGQRGFLLTGLDRYLEPYRQALTTVPAALDTLTSVTATRRLDQAQRVEALKPLVKEKLDELQRTIALRQNHHPDAALAIVLTDRGKAVMDQIREKCAEIQRVDSDRLTRARQRDSTGTSQHRRQHGPSCLSSACHHHDSERDSPPAAAH